VLNVNPVNSAFYRSELTEEEMRLATGGATTAGGHPLFNTAAYEATYPTNPGTPTVWDEEGKGGLPIINMVAPKVGFDGEIVHSDINAIIAYDSNQDFQFNGNGHFPASTYPLESVGKRNPTVPNRLEPFREFTIAFHDEVTTKQAFPMWFEDPVLQHTLHGVRDSFMINYGSGGIGTEIIANRLRVGPPHDCINCAYEEFFLTFFTVGEVAQLVDIPANVGLENCDPNNILATCLASGPKANEVLFPGDPSNVHHSYTGDFLKYRNSHAGPGEQHIFHQHNHQWLFNANDDNSNYLDAQGIGPGSGYTYEFVNGGAGNRNKTAGDAIFHCHFYPHFAQGMWAMSRVHDTFETGTELAVSGAGVFNGPAGVSGFHTEVFGLVHGTPGDVEVALNFTDTDGTRALPDAEVKVGAPTPAVVPLPGKPMPPMPAGTVNVVANTNTVDVCIDNITGLRVPRNSTPPGACPLGTTSTPDATGSLSDIQTIDDDADGVADNNPGYPFWIAGMEHSVGQRPTTPPLDMITQTQAAALKANGPDGLPSTGDEALWQHPGFADTQAIDGWDGGLPRFTLDGFSAGGEAIVSLAEARLDLTKDIIKAKPFFFPEEGTALEKGAMAYHAIRNHPTCLPDGTCDTGVPSGTGTVKFVLNGAPPVPGAPYQEPCVDDQGVLLAENVTGDFFSGENLTGMSVQGKSPHNATDPRVFKAANVQFDAVFNKVGYHYSQQRIITLWQDVVPTINKERPPEPMVLRMNTFDCTQYVHSNVVPKNYELDDYQVRTPTDIIGQHIHLPKWDLTTADGAANGWNYEDGTLSPGMVQEVIHSINNWQDDPLEPDVTTDVEGNVVTNSAGVAITDYPGNHLLPLAHSFFGDTEFGGCPDGPWCGTRSTMQRWFTDPVVNVQGIDRGLGIIFTHDHYGPSTHQQIGLYATVLIEPAGSKWVHNETGQQLGQSPGGGPGEPGRIDGGPTSWQAAILTGADGFGSYYTQNVGANEVENHREFYFEYTDFQHAYQPGVYVGADDKGFPLAEYVYTQGPEVFPGQFLNIAAFGDPAANINLAALGIMPTAQPGAIGPDPESFRDTIQPPIRLQAPLVSGFPVDIWEFPPFCDEAGLVPRPCPEAISADDPGMYVVNYRNESLAARVFDPAKEGPDGKLGTQAQAKDVDMNGVIDEFEAVRGDLAFAMWSGDMGQPVPRAIPALNTKLGLAPSTFAGNPAGCPDGAGGTVFCPPINNLDVLAEGDPFTPMMRALDGDRVHMKVQTGAHEEEHTKIVHGLKWLQSGSGFGEAKNSGWRNAQPGGISEQFSFRMPITSDKAQAGPFADYAYSVNASFDGWVSGTWGLLRSFRTRLGDAGDLFPLPNNRFPGRVFFTNNGDFNGVCPEDAPLRTPDVTAVLAEDVLPVPAGVTVQDKFPLGTHEGRAPNGGTLVYNSRPDAVKAVDPLVDPDHLGPLHDPTAILYVFTEDLVFDPAGVRTEYGDPIALKAETPVEPLVIRANAGDCIEVTLRNALLAQAVDANLAPVFDAGGVPVFLEQGDPNALFTDQAGLVHAVPPIAFDRMPDLATGNSITAMVRRDDGAGPVGMTSFQSNLMTPSPYAGLHAALVEYDVTRDDGTAVGRNMPEHNIAEPGKTVSYRWYAGDLGTKVVRRIRNITRMERVATPIEFGGFNLMAADKLEQPQKGMLGAGVIYPAGSAWTVDTGTTTEADVGPDANYDGVPDTVAFRDFTTVAQKGASMFYKDSFPVENILGEGSFGVAEDAQDMGQMAINYGTEPLWFRFGVNPTNAGGNAGAGLGFLGGQPNAGDAYDNGLVGLKTDPASDPQTAVFDATPGQPFRMHVLMPSGPGRGSTFDLHGHVWQRDPYICDGSADLGLAGKCDMGNGHAGAAGTGEVGSQNLGNNPIGFGLGAIESWFPGEHYEVVIPSAGGGNAVQGDYLFRDHMGLGNADGLWGIVRVEAP
jgi:hypothetical protein